MRGQLLAVLAIGALGVTAGAQAPPERPRARDLGLAPGVFEPGPLNAITDVAGVAVGHTTLREGDGVRTGVTAVVPHGGNLFQDKVAGGVFVGNAFGKLAGSTQVEELGTIETPIVLTNTLAVGAAVEGVVQWTLANDGNTAVRSVNALVGETNDGGLNDIRTLSVRPSHVVDLKAVPELWGGVTEPDGWIRVAASTVITDLVAHPVVAERFPALVEAALVVGSGCRTRLRLAPAAARRLAAQFDCPVSSIHRPSTDV